MRPDNIEDIYPLTALQEGMLFHTLDEPGSGLYVEQFSVRLGPALDVAAFASAWQLAVERHSALRACFIWEKLPRPMQVIARRLQLPLEREDWSALSQEERQLRLEHMLLEEQRQGFELQRAPLMRLRLMDCGAAGYHFVWSAHHLLLDGWSAQIIFEEVLTAYQAMREGRSVELGPTRPFSDYLRWLAGVDHSEAESYWRAMLRGFSEPTALPGGRDSGQAGRGEVLMSVGAELSERLKLLARTERVTLNTIMQGAWALVLSAGGGQSDVVFGATVAGRPADLEGAQRMVGPFINTVPVRVRLDERDEVGPWLRHLQQQAGQASQYEHSSLAEVGASSEVARGQSLFQTLLVFESYPETVGSSGLGLVSARELRTEGRSNFAVSVMVWPGPELGVKIGYARAWYDEEGARTLLRWLKQALEGLARSGGEGLVADISVLSQEERRKLEQWNETEEEYPRQHCLHQLFEAQVARTPEHLALIFGEERLSYRELNERANHLAHYLRELGVGPEVRVGVLMERSIELVVSLLGVLKAGGAYVPLDPHHPTPHLSFIMEDATVAVLLTLERLAGQAPAHWAHLVCLDSEWAEIASHSTAQQSPSNGELTSRAALSPQPSADNALYVLYTSGSTGTPKGVVVSHRSVVNYLCWAMQAYDAASAQGSPVHSPLSFDLTVTSLFTPLLAGRAVTLVAQDEVGVTALARALRQEGCFSLIKLTPAHLDLLAQELKPEEAAEATRAFVIGGEALAGGQLEYWRRQAPHVRLINEYGPTETVVGCCTYEVGGVEEAGGSEAESRSVPIGRPIANTQVYVLDERMKLVPLGVSGELYIGGEGLARGYLNQAQLTAEKFLPNPFAAEGGARLYRSGDWVRWLPEGELEFIGRVDQQVKLRGYRIELGEIESSLRSHPGLAEAAVVVTDEGADKKLVAYVVAHTQGNQQRDSLSSSQLREHVKRMLPEYMVPAVFVMLEELPLTANGKVDRQALPVPEWAAGGAGAYVRARTPLEEVVCGVWGEVLGVEQISAQDNFFELGGHSLLATQVASRLKTALGVELPLRALFEYPTMMELAREVERMMREGYGIEAPPLVPVGRDGELPLSFAQQRLWFLDQLEPGSSFYNIPAALHLSGPLNRDALEQALNEVVRRHEVLRTSFPMVDGRARQLIAEAQPIALTTTDLSGLPEVERQTEVERLAGVEAQQPFNLGQGALLRARLLRLGEDEYALIFVVHHIVSDGWSVGIIVREVATLYEAFTQSNPSPLAELPIQYADYAYWQQGWLRGEVLEAQVSYWKKQLSGVSHILDLPSDRPRPAIQSFRGAQQPFFLSAELSKQLKALSRREGVTLFMTLLAAFQTLLYRYTSQDDVIVGSPIANRTRAEVEGLIGFFVNMLVLRTHVGGDPSFVELLGRVREVTLGAYANQDLPFEKLVEELQPERDLRHSPLFQVMFMLQNASSSELKLTGVTLTPLGVSTPTAKFDLTLLAQASEDGISGSLEYNTDLFDAATIERMAAHFQVLVEGICADSGQRVSRLPLLTETERQQLLTQWNETQTEFAADKCIHHLFESQVERTPHAIALTFEDERLTYEELNTRANQLAQHLMKLGVGPEVPVGLYLERSLEMMVGVLGVLKAGGAYLPLDPQYPGERLSFMMEDSRVPVLLTQQCLIDTLPAGAAQIVCLDRDWETIAEESRENVGGDAEAENLAYVIYTSGSTGQPKGVQISHQSVTNFLYFMREQTALTSQDLLLAVTTLSFDIAVLELLLPLIVGARVMIVSRQVAADGHQLLERLNRSGTTVMQATPATWRLLLSAGWAGNAGLKILCGGEALPRDLAHQLFTRGAALWNLFGPTETTIWSSLSRVESAESEVSIGRPIANTQIYILDAESQPVPVGIAGELYIGGRGVARGYQNRPGLTAEKFVPDPFSREAGARLYRTGDLARYLPDGNLEFLGRLDHQVKIRGYRIELGEIETMVAASGAVRQCVVVAREDALGESRLVAYVVENAKPQKSEAAMAETASQSQQDSLSQPVWDKTYSETSSPRQPTAFNLTGRDSSYTGEPIPAEEMSHANNLLRSRSHDQLVSHLRQCLREKLPEYMVPTAYVVLDEMPLTANGKVDRKALPAPEWAATSTVEYVRARTPLEEVVCGVWGEVLGVEEVGAQDNFFELGGHSLLATQVISRLRQSFSVELPLRALFACPTVAELAREVERMMREGRGVEAPPLVPVGRDRELPLSFAQQRLWFIDQLEPDSFAYHMPAAVRLEGRLDADALSRALTEIVRRHESLRTSFPAIEGRAVQVIHQPQPLLLPVEDLSELGRDEREAEVRRMASDEIRRPFDLFEGPLLRARLLRLSEDEHVLIVVMHHIITDGWSLGLLVREVNALYEAFSEGGASPLSELPVQYADYAVWQKQWLHGEVLDEHLSYWKRRLAGVPAVLDLPTDRPHRATQSFRGAGAGIEIETEVTEALRGLSRREGATLFMTLLAAWQTLLSQYSGQQDLVVGTDIANRTRAEVESLIGFFVNQLALRTDLSGDPTFLELLGRVREVTLGAYAYQDLPFDKLVETINPDRALSRTPLFQVKLVLHNNPPVGALVLPKLSFRPLEGQEISANFELQLNLWEDGGRLSGTLWYNAELFEPETITRLNQNFITLLRHIVAHPESRLSDLTELLAGEQRQYQLSKASEMHQAGLSKLRQARRKVSTLAQA